MRVEDCEVGGEHGCRDLATVGAVADEGAGESGSFGREGELHGATEAGCRRGVVLGPAIVGSAGKGEVGLGFIWSGSHGSVYLLWGNMGLIFGAVDVGSRGEKVWDYLFAVF